MPGIEPGPWVFKAHIRPTDRTDLHTDWNRTNYHPTYQAGTLTNELQYANF